MSEPTDSKSHGPAGEPGTAIGTAVGTSTAATPATPDPVPAGHAELPAKPALVSPQLAAALAEPSFGTLPSTPGACGGGLWEHGHGGSPARPPIDDNPTEPDPGTVPFAQPPFPRLATLPRLIRRPRHNPRPSRARSPSAFRPRVGPS